MKTISVYNLKKEETGTISAPERIFGASWKQDLVHQAIVTQQANSRNIVADAKDRSEVRGGGKKPWKQKGTGRARHGSTRSPLWIGGGVTHGPLAEKVYARKINKKMKAAALFSLLSKKLNENSVVVVEEFAVAQPAKTKAFTQLVSSIVKPTEKTLFVCAPKNKSIHNAVRNTAKWEAISPASLNTYDVACAKNIVFEKEAIELFIDKNKKAEK